MATLLLNNFNGSDGSTTFTDEVGGVTWSRPYVGAANELDTGLKKFGSASWLGLSSNEYDAIAQGSGFTFPTSGSWTLEGFVAVTTIAASGSYVSIELIDDSNVLWAGMGIAAGTGNNLWYADVYTGSSHNASSSAGFSVNTFYHFALVRDADADTYSAFVNGSRVAQWSDATDIGGTVTKVQLVGTYQGTTYGPGGWVDAVRLTDDVQYSGSTYTVPSTEFVYNIILAPAADTVGVSETAALTTAIYLGATDTVSVSEVANLSVSTEFMLGEDIVTTVDSADLTTAIPLEATDTVTTSAVAALTVPPTVILVPPTGGANYQGDINVGEVLKPAIPPTTDLPYALLKILDPMKENIETITGRRGGKIQTLPADATLEQTVERLNLVISRLMS